MIASSALSFCGRTEGPQSFQSAPARSQDRPKRIRSHSWAVLVAFIVAALSFLLSAPSAKAVTYTPPASTKGWCTAVAPGTEQCGFADPQSACDKQHQVYGGPGALRVYSNATKWYLKLCNWKSVFGYSSSTYVTFECQSGYSGIAPSYCVAANDAFPKADCGCSASKGAVPTPTTPHPINIIDGSKGFTAADFTLADGGLAITRHFESRPAGDGGGNSLIRFPLGFANWRYGFDFEIDLGSDWGASGYLALITPNGGYYPFMKSGSAIVPKTTSTYPTKNTDYAVQFIGTLPATNSALLNASSSWTVTGPDNRIWYLDTAFDVDTGLFDIARPTRMVEPGGLEYAFAYSGGSLFSVTDSLGRALRFDWLQVGGLGSAISQVTLPDGTTLNYGYDSLFSGTGVPDRLLSVERRQGATVLDRTSYDYDNTSYPLLVTGIHDKDGVLRWSVTYDDQGRALTSQGAGGAHAYSVAYGPSGTTFTRTVTTPEGKNVVYTFTRSSGAYNVKLSSVVEQVSPNSPTATSSLTYDANSYISTQTDKEGRVTGFTRDTSARPTQVVEAQGSPVARTSNLTWHSVLNTVTQVVAPGLTTNDAFASGTSAGSAPPPTYVASQSFAFTGAAQTYTVPVGVTSATIQLWGGAGGTVVSTTTGAWSGAGAVVQAAFAVSPGDILQFEVGGGGAGATSTGPGGAGGWPDGGSGAQNANPGAGGGGSTRFYVNGTLRAVAGAGGGSAGYPGSNAGAGGGQAGQDAVSGGGTGGSQTAGGVDSNDSTVVNKMGRSLVAFPGAQRTGGWGTGYGTNILTSSDNGAGGGGGYWGGGGGGSGRAAGGGGSSWVDPSATGVLTLGGYWMKPASTPPGQPTVATAVFNGATVAATGGGNGYATVGLN